MFLSFLLQSLSRTARHVQAQRETRDRHARLSAAISNQTCCGALCPTSSGTFCAFVDVRLPLTSHFTRATLFSVSTAPTCPLSATLRVVFSLRLGRVAARAYGPQSSTLRRRTGKHKDVWRLRQDLARVLQATIFTINFYFHEYDDGYDDNLETASVVLLTTDAVCIRLSHGVNDCSLLQRCRVAWELRGLDDRCLFINLPFDVNGYSLLPSRVWFEFVGKVDVGFPWSLVETPCLLAMATWGSCLEAMIQWVVLEFWSGLLVRTCPVFRHCRA